MNGTNAASVRERGRGVRDWINGLGSAKHCVRCQFDVGPTSIEVTFLERAASD